MPTYATGAVRSPVDPRDWLAPRVATARAAVLPQQVMPVVLPPVLNQGAEGTCVGHAVASLLTWAALRAGFKRYISPRDAYENTRLMMFGRPAEGADVRTAMHVAKRLGVCEERFRPYVAGSPCDPLEGANDSRPDNKISAFARVDSTNTRAMREALCIHSPLVIAAPVRDGFVKPDGYHTAHFSGEDAGGLHAMLALGYSDARQAYWVQNSWGEEYADKGRVWVPYTYPIEEAWSIVPNVAKDRPAEVPFVPWWERASFMLPWWS